MKTIIEAYKEMYEGKTKWKIGEYLYHVTTKNKYSEIIKGGLKPSVRAQSADDFDFKKTRLISDNEKGFLYFHGVHMWALYWGCRRKIEYGWKDVIILNINTTELNNTIKNYNIQDLRNGLFETGQYELVYYGPIIPANLINLEFDCDKDLPLNINTDEKLRDYLGFNNPKLKIKEN